MRKLLLLAVVACAACGGNKDDTSGGSGSAAPSERPAAITKEMADTFDAYISAFEKLVNEIAAAKSDCKAVIAAIERNTKEVAAMASRGDALREGLKGAKGNKEAGEWFGATYGPRMKDATMKLDMASGSCTSDPAFRAALDEAMSKYPMMRKKKS
jgi:hypothetical protein